MNLLYFLTLLSALNLIKCEIPKIEIDDKEDEKVVLLKALFSKLNWMMIEIEKINKNINTMNERFSNQTQDENKNLQLLKAEIRELNHTIKTDGMEMKHKLFQRMDLQEKSFNETIDKLLIDGMEMRQKLFQRNDLQENLLAKSSKGIESLNTTINKMSQMPNWLTILKRQDGSENFDRNWLDYKNGFGNPNGEYFIGLDKLYAITNYGGPYELLIVLKDFDNSTRYAKYDNFLVGNETEKYKLKNLGEFSGDAGDSFSYNFNSSFSTRDQDNDNDTENCASYHKGGWWFNNCYHSHSTGPYYTQSNKYYGIFWYSWHSLGYSLKYVEMMIRQTIKTDIMEMKQKIIQRMDLQENMIAKASKDVESVKKMLQINPVKQIPNWLTILKRQDGSENFDRNWLDYKNGFGNPNGEYFIGLDKLHAITNYGGQQELLIVLKDFDNSTRYAKYDSFVVGNETEKYKLKNLGEFSGDAGDSFSYHLNQSFTTKDQDNDYYSGNCASYHKGGWWFGSCYKAHLTGPYYHQPNISYGITWYSWHGLGYSFKFVEMMIRLKS